MTISEFLELPRNEQIKQMLSALPKLLIVQCRIFILEAIHLNSISISRQNTNFWLEILRIFISHPEFRVYTNILDRLLQLNADKTVFLLVSIITLLDHREFCEIWGHRSSKYVRLMGRYIHLKYQDADTGLLLHFSVDSCEICKKKNIQLFFWTYLFKTFLAISCDLERFPV